MQKIVTFNKPIESYVINNAINADLRKGWIVKEVKESDSIFGKIIFVLEKKSET